MQFNYKKLWKIRNLILTDRGLFHDHFSDNIVAKKKKSRKNSKLKIRTKTVVSFCSYNTQCNI